MPRVVVHLKKKKQRYHNVTLAAGSFSLDVVQDRIDGLIRAREIAIKVCLVQLKFKMVCLCFSFACPFFIFHAVPFYSPALTLFAMCLHFLPFV